MINDNCIPQLREEEARYQVIQIAKRHRLLTYRLFELRALEVPWEDVLAELRRRALRLLPIALLLMHITAG